MVEFEKMPDVHPEATHYSYNCGSCQWFTGGFNGNCQTRRGVEIATKACIEYTEPLKDYFQEITVDKYILDIRKDIAEGDYFIEDRLLEEVRSYLVHGDLSKYQFGTSQDLQAMTEFLKMIIQYRARVSNIYTSILDLKHNLEVRVCFASSWLNSKYSIIRNLKNEGQRKAALHRLIPGLILAQENLEKAISTTKFIDDKLDANERTLGKILSASEKLWFTKKGMG